MLVHYLIPVTIGISSVGLMIWFRKQIISKIGNTWWIHITGFVAIYITIVWLVFCGEVILNNQLQEFDLNNDGIFTNEEITVEQMDTMRRVSNDTARKLSIYTSLIYSGFITIVLFLVYLFKIHILGENNNKTNT